MSKFKKHLPAKIIAELKSDEDFSEFQSALDYFDIDDLQSLQSNFFFIFEELGGDYEKNCEALYAHFSLIESLLNTVLNSTDDEQKRIEIVSVKAEYERMWNYIADELRRFVFYKESISRSFGANKSGDSSQNTNEENLKSNSDIIRLLHETGIIKHLRNIYPNATANSVAKFFELITRNPLIASNTNSLFSTDPTTKKYLMKGLTPTQKEKLKIKLEEFKFF